MRDEDFPAACFNDKEPPLKFDPDIYIHQDDVSNDQKQ